MTGLGCSTRLVSTRHFTTLIGGWRSRFDPKAWEPPTTDLVDLAQPVSAEDPRTYNWIRPMHCDETPVFYRDHTIDKLACHFCQHGRKQLSRDIILDAMEIIKRRQYKAWLNAKDEDKANIELNAFKLTRQAIRNCQPLMKLIPYKKGGIVYQVPTAISEKEAEFRAMKMMRTVCREKSRHHERGKAFEVLASELLLAYKHEGLTIQAKQELHKQCEANRAFTHFRAF